MMTNLFSIFDPHSPLFNNWVMLVMIFLVVPKLFWLLNNTLITSVNMMLTHIYQEFKLLINSQKSLGLLNLFLSCMFFILINNFLGLFYYTFTATSHMIPGLTLSLPIWLTLMLWGWLNNTKFMLAHLVPQSTPTALMPFMVLIESISNIIRPLTLAIRLTANMIAGHLLLTLLGNQVTESHVNLTLPLLNLSQFILLTLESAVAIIQAYVFTVLITLYSSEIYYDN